jgi:hypothetical protein
MTANKTKKVGDDRQWCSLWRTYDGRYRLIATHGRSKGSRARALGVARGWGWGAKAVLLSKEEIDRLKAAGWLSK